VISQMRDGTKVKGQMCDGPVGDFVPDGANWARFGCDAILL
jgi:hypothetical protein